MRSAPTERSRPAQSQFERAVALLPSFWYEEAVKAFTAVTESDPNCAMGYWGIGMSMYYPLWQPPSAATLQKGWATVEKAKAAGAKTQPERDYIAAIEAFYKAADKLAHRTRAVAYEKAMERVYARNPRDNEAAVFYALALDSTADPSDKTYANQLKAAAILEKVYREEPNHPGVAHYLIHSYDYPPLANRALVPARSYAKIAPSVPHAQHMPSRVALERHRWSEAAALAPHPAEFPWKRFQWGEAITSFARALGAARSGDAATARQEADKL